MSATYPLQTVLAHSMHVVPGGTSEIVEGDDSVLQGSGYQRCLCRCGPADPGVFVPDSRQMGVDRPYRDVKTHRDVEFRVATQPHL